jgi:hypothetical protein
MSFIGVLFSFLLSKTYEIWFPCIFKLRKGKQKRKKLLPKKGDSQSMDDIIFSLCLGRVIKKFRDLKF